MKIVHVWSNKKIAEVQSNKCALCMMYVFVSMAPLRLGSEAHTQQYLTIRPPGEETEDGGITNVPAYAFRRCTALVSITFPSTLVAIGAGAFSGCTDLASVELPSLCVAVDYSAFAGCTALTTLILPSSVTSISQFAFRGCPLPAPTRHAIHVVNQLAVT